MRSSTASYVVAIGLAVIFLGGCAGLASLSQSPADKVQIIEGSTSRKYKVIKELSVYMEKGNPQYYYVGIGNVELEMKRQALSVGADAVINVRYHDEPMSFFGKGFLGAGSWGSVSGKGLAVKFLN
jgi:hypothetical protein